MPGPCSAPNGQISIVEMKRGDSGKTVKSGKTAYKRGQIKHAGKEGQLEKIEKSLRHNRKLSRAQREAQEQS